MISPYTAPYRFVRIPGGFVAAPPVPRDAIRFDRPLDGGSVSATIKVTWTAKTPICIGDPTRNADGTAGIVEPLELGGRYCLPGTTLRGMLRAVLEAASFSHLGRINDRRHHGVRDFKGIGDQTYAADKVKAGWLKYDPARKIWLLYPAKSTERPGQPKPKDRENQPAKKELHGFDLLTIDSILDAIGHSVSKSQWRLLDVRGKYEVLARFQNTPIGSLRDFAANTLFKAPSDTAKYPRASLQNHKLGWFVGKFEASKYVLVCTGAFATDATDPKSRENEALFPPPGEQGHEIPDEYMQVFHRLNSDPARQGGDPRDGSWRTWLLAMHWHEVFKGFKLVDGEIELIPAPMRNFRYGIPVFWKGDLSDLTASPPHHPGRQGFWFSLSRVIRVPYANSVGETAQRLYDDKGGPYRVPRMRELRGWDFARALFGEVDGANVGPEEEQAKGAAGSTAEEAQRGRIAVGFAWAPVGTRPGGGTYSGVFSQPRESFWPFYMRDRDNADLMSSYALDGAVPAGRKRTVVRRTAVPATEWPQGNADERGAPSNANIRTAIRFLPDGTSFSGHIRVHNLHPVEFGALLWVLGFGRTDGSRWHQAGRAKGMGHGALSPDFHFDGAPKICGDVTVPPDRRGDANAWIALFVAHMTEKLTAAGEPAFDAHGSIRALVAAADPATGDRLRAGLRTGSLEDYQEWRKENKSISTGIEPLYPLPLP